MDKKNAVLISSSEAFAKQHAICHFSLSSQNSEYPRIFRVTGANQNARKLLSTDLVNTETIYDATQTVSPTVIETEATGHRDQKNRGLEGQQKY